MNASTLSISRLLQRVVRQHQLSPRPGSKNKAEGGKLQDVVATVNQQGLHSAIRELIVDAEAGSNETRTDKNAGPQTGETDPRSPNALEGVKTSAHGQKQSFAACANLRLNCDEMGRDLGGPPLVRQPSSKGAHERSGPSHAS